MNNAIISWAEKTWNPTTGCTKCSSLCNLCYAEKETNIRANNPKFDKYRLGFDVVVEHPNTLSEPFNISQPTTIFVNSMSDLFHKDVSLDFIKKVFDVMNQTPQHTYMVLTKRYHLLEKYSDELNWSDNIYMGVSVGDKISTRGIASLQKCGAKKKFLSVEPLIEEITDMNLEGIDLVIVGGESGGDLARPMPREWVIKVKELCDTQNVTFFFKQWGMKRNNPDQNDPTLNRWHRYHTRSGCMLDGKIYLGNPANRNQTIPTMTFFGDEYYVMDEVDDLKTIWELKSHLPMMEEDLFNELKADIKANGINDPILYWVTPDGEKLVIEGHTRLMAAIQSNRKDIPTKEIKESFKNLDEIKLWMIKHQFKKRNLSDEQKLELAYRSKETIERVAKENLSKVGKKQNVETPVDTTAEIARIAGVGRSTVVRYAFVMKNAPEYVKEGVRTKKITIGGAYNTLKQSEDKGNKKVDEAVPKKVDEVVNRSNPTTSMPKNITIVESIDAGTTMVNSGQIDALIILKDKDQVGQYTQKKIKIGVYVLEQTMVQVEPIGLNPALDVAA